MNNGDVVNTKLEELWKTKLTDLEKPEAAGSITNSCDLPGSIQSSGASFLRGSLPVTSNTHIVCETWAARNNAETWDNENGFRNQADGYFG
ncbi:MAG: hypothetical protein WAL41_27915 [Mycobacterium sp.]